MEFFPVEASAGAGAQAVGKLFEGDTLIVPAVSYANLGQLTVDLIVNTLLQRGNECDAQIEKVGHLFSTAVPPIAGATAYGSQDRNALTVNLEVFRIPSRRVTLIQQRTDVTKGKARAFAAELVDWAAANGFASLVVVAGADDMLRHDPNMLRRPLNTIAFADNDQSLRNVAFLDASSAVKTAEATAWRELRGVGVAPLLHARCVASASSSSPIGFAAFLLSCAEGNNVPDAMAMASHVLHYLEIKLPAPPAPPASFGAPLPPPPPFVFPPSWSHLFGRGPDASLFL